MIEVEEQEKCIQAYSNSRSLDSSGKAVGATGRLSSPQCFEEEVHRFEGEVG